MKSTTIPETLNTQKIVIVGKKTCIESESKKTVEYVFLLNSPVDSTWNALFQSELSVLPSGVSNRDLKVEIQGPELHLHCFPVNLESKLSVVKAAIERTNGNYPRRREQVLKKAAALNEKRERERAAKKNRAEEIADQFDRLQI